MSKEPSPRADQLRAMREARYYRNQELMREQEARDAAAAKKEAAPVLGMKRPTKKRKAAKGRGRNQAKV
ncbi:hypothetical protein [Bradyrhizobium sp. Leo170]|uniref:hypothetical protein n=1 Tax=Bradyrhizobium sp. Leo170 TaxID=1571199 RepID=UPI00102EC246|nr:hypothetical protein [Bradyrhizobium sp. Leo170]TAI67601.1 hypothetical protein CWO89_01935 [Bradyrhizobium sp. Leo170]